jgi:hypothetical protein
MKCTKVAEHVQWQWGITSGDCVISAVRRATILDQAVDGHARRLTFIVKA